MVFRKIGKDVKDWAIDLYYEGFVPRDIWDFLGISSRSRPRILNSEQVFSICEQLNKVPKTYLDEIQDWGALTMQASISKSALSELIQDAGYPVQDASQSSI
ncbi:hypothetical protein BDM02DRAFT_3185037 [Thelephora ganbajun]|uniref:Uncharacterized protein n=1 Tax=Thelephora ganbajun TaxID=370292 RepID=A0ACB6ZP08_THEGA|nr:hypothetical protein BDM02DRAFT_3185037 [Thelephora ganbajun]